jgi:hypothetical protein
MCGSVTRKLFTIASFDFYISTLILKLENNLCHYQSLTEATTPNSIQESKLHVELEVPTLGPHNSTIKCPRGP